MSSVAPESRPRAGLLLAALLLGAPPAFGKLRPMTLEELVDASEEVVCGQVVSLRSYRAPFLGRGEVIFTDVTVRITERITGTLRESTVIVQVPGGRVGDRFMICPDAPRYRQGERVLLFLRRFNGKRWNTGWSHGKYLIDTVKTAGGARDVVRGHGERPIGGLVDLEGLRQEIRAIRTRERTEAPR